LIRHKIDRAIKEEEEKLCGVQASLNEMDATMRVARQTSSNCHGGRRGEVVDTILVSEVVDGKRGAAR
jgi:hypothetical protein